LPLYEYCCEQCGFKYEKIQKFDAEPEVKCPKCGGELFRPLTAPALQFKGAGWYVNDYAPKAASSAPAGDAAKSGSDEKPAAAAESKSGGESTSGSDSKTGSESKPAAAAPTAKPAAAPSSSSTTT